MRIKYVAEIEGSPVVQYVANAWCLLMRDNFWDRDSVLVTGNLSCLYAVENKKIIACLTWHGDVDNWTINIGFVSEGHRRNGIYDRLHSELVKRAVAAGVKQITSIVKPSNAPIRGSKDKNGYLLHSLYYIKNLRDTCKPLPKSV